MKNFKAFRVYKEGLDVSGRYETLRLEDLNPGEVIIEARYSSVNYKDALGATGKGAILKKFPLVAGIDVAGVVLSSASESIKAGDEVLVTGCGLGEDHDGGLSQIVRVPKDFVVPLPEGLSLFDAMALGTAGFTAALALERMLVNGQVPEMGPIVVTGASGGVGHFAVSLFAKAGFDVLAISAKESCYGFLKELGAAKVMPLEELALSDKPLTKTRFGGAVDNLGDKALSGLLPAVAMWGNVASVGVAMGHEISGTVFPHILRGVSLLGISSTNASMPVRRKIWQHLATDWRVDRLQDIVTETIPLSQVDEVFDRMLARKTFGRVVVDCLQ